jgi:hypothetical protein
MTQATTVQAPKRRFTVREYHRLMEVGILQENDRVELIHGEIIQMSPIGPKHAGNVDRIIVHTDPSEDQYLNIKTFRMDEQIESPALPRSISTRELLG